MQAEKRAAFANVFCLSLRWRRAIRTLLVRKFQTRRRTTADCNGDEITLGVFRPTAVYGPGDKG